jgi:hypothetical protein
MMKKFSPETSSTASTWTVQPIYMIKDGPENSPTACAGPIQSIYMMKKVGPDISPRDSTGLPRIPLEPLHFLYGIYI